MLESLTTVLFSTSFQTAKVFRGLLSGDYSPEPPLGMGPEDPVDFSIIRSDDDERKQNAVGFVDTCWED